MQGHIAAVGPPPCPRDCSTARQCHRTDDQPVDRLHQVFRRDVGAKDSFAHRRQRGPPVTVTETVVEEQVVKSRHRVKSYGEVFTPRHMVNKMLDLVREDLEIGPDFVDKTFLEPAAGHGNFLVAILHRKLRAVEKKYPIEKWPEASLFALA